MGLPRPELLSKDGDQPAELEATERDIPSPRVEDPRSFRTLTGSRTQLVSISAGWVGGAEKRVGTPSSNGGGVVQVMTGTGSENVLGLSPRMPLTNLN